MPACHRCGKANQPRIEVRRTKLGFVCRNLVACVRRRQDAKAQREAA